MMILWVTFWGHVSHFEGYLLYSTVPYDATHLYA